VKTDRGRAIEKLSIDSQVERNTPGQALPPRVSARPCRTYTPFSIR
jgi:hypothetical protein